MGSSLLSKDAKTKLLTDLLSKDSSEHHALQGSSQELTSTQEEKSVEPRREDASKFFGEGVSGMALSFSRAEGKLPL